VIAFAEANFRLRIAVEASQSNIACELVRAGAGIAILDGLGLLSARYYACRQSKLGWLMRAFLPA